MDLWSLLIVLLICNSTWEKVQFDGKLSFWVMGTVTYSWVKSPFSIKNSNLHMEDVNFTGLYVTAFNISTKYSHILWAFGLSTKPISSCIVSQPHLALGPTLQLETLTWPQVKLVEEIVVQLQFTHSLLGTFRSYKVTQISCHESRHYSHTETRLPRGRQQEAG
jgi:hypothetical protein